MAEICRICLKAKDVLNTNVLEYVDIVENLVEIEFDRNPELPQMICTNCELRLSNVKRTCALCVNSYEFFLKFVPKQEKMEAISDYEDADYVNLEILDEALESPEDLKAIKTEPMNPSDEFPIPMKVKLEDEDAGQVADPKIEKLVTIVNQQLKSKSVIGNVTFCKMPKKIVVAKARTYVTETKSRSKSSFPLTYYHCCKCTEVVFSNEHAERHFIDSHPTSERHENEIEPTEHQCKFCLNYFHTADELKNHRSSEKNESNSPSFVYTCPIPLCNQSGLSLANYKVHGETKHGSEATYCCNICPISYKNFSSFMSHVYVKHKNEKNNVCAECGKSYARKSYLESHYRVEHQGRRDFLCTHCDAVFKRSSNLRSHMRVHTGEKPYKCKNCPKEYSHYIDLKTHIAYRHTGVFPYNCTVCGRGYVKPSQLKIHMRKHAITTEITSIKMKLD